MRIKVFSFILLFTVNSQLSTVNCFAQDKIIAVVNNEVITQKDLNDFINFTRIQLAQQYKGQELENKIQQLEPDLLKKLIEDRLILQEAKKSGIRIDENRVKARVEEIRRRYSNEEDFEADLAKQGFVQADIENRIREQFLTYAIVDTQVRNKITISPAEVTQYYQKHAQEFKIPEEWEFTSLSTENGEEADAAVQELRKGARLEDVAGKHSLSVDKIKASRGGQLKKELEEQLFKLDKGEISDPIKVAAQYYIFRLDNILAPQQEGLSQAQEKITLLLTDKKLEEAMAKWMDEVKKRSYINICQG